MCTCSDKSNHEGRCVLSAMPDQLMALIQSSLPGSPDVIGFGWSFSLPRFITLWGVIQVFALYTRSTIKRRGKLIYLYRPDGYKDNVPFVCKGMKFYFGKEELFNLR